MNHSYLWKLSICLFLVSFSLLSAISQIDSPNISDRVNLALRQTGHDLLSMNGDSTSSISPISTLSEDRFVLKLDQAFKYEMLPDILKRALADYNIDLPYQVMIQDCHSEETILGYNTAATNRNDIPCATRHEPSDCSNIVLILNPNEQVIAGVSQDAPRSGLAKFWWTIPLLFGAGFLLWFFRIRKIQRITEVHSEPNSIDLTSLSPATPTTPETTEVDPNIMIGEFIFDPKNQWLSHQQNKHQLTYRETKLLHLFATQLNEVITRDELLSNVWGEEGVIVGRSLDVFVSRLRKILKEDDSVKIKNIHGVGYRLEVA